MNISEAYKQIDDIEKRIDEEVYPACSHNTELLVYAQTKGMLVFLKAMLNEKIEEQNGRTVNSK